MENLLKVFKSWDLPQPTKQTIKEAMNMVRRFCWCFFLSLSLSFTDETFQMWTTFFFVDLFCLWLTQRLNLWQTVEPLLILSALSAFNSSLNHFPTRYSQLWEASVQTVRLIASVEAFWRLTFFCLCAGKASCSSWVRFLEYFDSSLF